MEQLLQLAAGGGRRAFFCRLPSSGEMRPQKNDASPTQFRVRKQVAEDSGRGEDSLLFGATVAIGSRWGQARVFLLPAVFRGNEATKKRCQPHTIPRAEAGRGRFRSGRKIHKQQLQLAAAGAGAHFFVACPLPGKWATNNHACPTTIPCTDLEEPSPDRPGVSRSRWPLWSAIDKRFDNERAGSMALRASPGTGGSRRSPETR